VTRDALPSKRIAGALVQHFPWCAKWSLVSITVSGEDDTEVELDPEECLALRAFLDDALRMHAEAERADAAERAADEKEAQR